MLVQLLELYNAFEANKSKFTDRGLSGSFFLDVYRGQPLESELYEYFSLPAIFIDYSMQGQGQNQPRLVTMTAHIVTDEMPDASNISEQKTAGLNRFLYNLTIQEILEGCKLGSTSALKFQDEQMIDAEVNNYHTQSWQFEAYLSDMIGNPTEILGMFETLNIFGTLTNKL
jgi:hypothetical protein